MSPPVQQLVDDGVLAIVAGADTTSSALSSLFFSLVTHPGAYDRLQAEVDRFYPQGENTGDTKHHRDMHYLTAIMYVTIVARERGLCNDEFPSQQRNLAPVSARSQR